MKKLRLLVTKKCDRSCPGCCNKQWNLDNLPVVESYEGYDEIMITGGEPSLFPGDIMKLVVEIRKVNQDAKIYLYTAFLDGMYIDFLAHWVDGITLTLHGKEDEEDFKKLNTSMISNRTFENNEGKSFRLNVFDGVEIDDYTRSRWDVKENKKWIENCPLPENEEFMRLSELFC